MNAQGWHVRFGDLLALDRYPPPRVKCRGAFGGSNGCKAHAVVKELYHTLRAQGHLHVGVLHVVVLLVTTLKFNGWKRSGPHAACCRQATSIILYLLLLTLPVDQRLPEASVLHR